MTERRDRQEPKGPQGRFGRLELGPREAGAGGAGKAPTGPERVRARTEEVADSAHSGSHVGTPIRTPAHHFAAAVEARNGGRFETALQLYTRALQGERALVPAWVGQVQMLVELGEYAEARLWADKALEVFKGNGDLLAAKAIACVREDDQTAAMACSDASLRAPGSSPLRWQARGETLLRRSADRARDCFEKSLAEAASDWFDRVIVARIYLHHDRPAPAVEYAQAAVRLEAGQWFAGFVLGRAQEALGWSGEAKESYLRAHGLPGGRVDAEAAMVALQARGAAAGILARLRHGFKGLFRR